MATLVFLAAAAGAGVVGADLLAAALAGAFASYHLRRRLGEQLPVPDPALGLAEDLIVIGAGTAILRALGPESAGIEEGTG